MPALTRRRDFDVQHERWRVFFGDIQIGVIGVRAGLPTNVDQWSWSCRSYPASHRGVRENGTATSFDAARTAFEDAWYRLLPQLTEVDFAERRRERAFDA